VAFLEKHLKIKHSNIKSAGMGLFTSVNISKGTRIVEYKGRITTWKEVERDIENGYLYKVNPQHVIDAKEDPKLLARYVNDANGLKKVNGLTNNCIYVQEGLRVYIDAMKDIPAGSELLVAYGKLYWEVIRAYKKKERNKNITTQDRVSVNKPKQFGG
jgi:SET domain-containing protein